ncbi:sugar-binding transcriptional regulator [Cytobacillus gottheilii]|uniref:sugar-binding transcriptional regulator n=1 Tax=Cytobacillus gottheilii TaxID=859144 RepID=UPI0024955C5F|nr:sugar-binding transcriptional regulator [Cytobacillus gottheilii]
MSSLEDRRLLVKVANMYYEEGATQSEIAKSIGVSRSLISKYLAKAKESGVVEIIIHDDEAHPYMALESKVERRYDLREVVCVSSGEGESVKARLGAAASKYLLRIIKDGQTIGISSGTTLNEVAKSLPSQHFSGLTIVPLVGGMGDERVDIHSNSIVAKVAESFHADYKLLHAPVLVDSKEAKEVIIQQSFIKTIFDIASKSDIAVVGIGGTPEHSTMVKSYLHQVKQKEFNYEGIVGDICYNFIDRNGEAFSNPWNDKVITMELENLKKIPLVIGVASGKEKVEAIRTSLVAKLIDVLITDENTAKELLD